MDTAKFIDSCGSLGEAFFRVAGEHPELEVYAQAINEREPGGKRKRISRTFAEVEQRVLGAAHFLKSIGVSKGSKVAILSSTRPEWCEADLAGLSLGAVVVSVYQSLPADDVGYILFDSESEVVFAENQEQVDKLLELLKAPISIPATEDRAASEVQIGLSRIIAFEEVAEHPLVTQWSELVAGSDYESLSGYGNVGRDDLAALVYTSGTTGPPKGVMQTHGNHLSNVRQAFEGIIIREDISIQMFLPLAHAFARLMGFLGFLTTTKLTFPAIIDTKSSKLDPVSLTEDIRDLDANIFPIVPRLLEKMQSGVLAKASSSGLIRLALNSARSVFDAKEAGKSASLWTQIVYQATEFIREKIKQKLFGTKHKFCVSGGAKLNPEVGKFFVSAGVPILEGYGLTETAVATNINRIDDIRIGTVGPVLASDIEMRICEDGEIAYRGPNITLGYYKRPTATDNAWDKDGWFYTGDLGEVTDDGFLSIVGRKKEIIVTSYGKNIAPEPIEAAMKNSEYISQAVLIGEGRQYCSVVIVLDCDRVKAWLASRGIDLKQVDYASDDRIHKLLAEEIEKFAGEFPDYEKPKKITIADEDFSVENGMMTPTFKVKRSVVEKNYGEALEALYASNA